MNDDRPNPYDLDPVGGITFGTQPRRVERRTVIEPEELAALRAENARLKAELAALKERRCETCKHVYHSELIPTRWVCVRLNENFEVSPDGDFCSRWQEREDTDGQVS